MPTIARPATGRLRLLLPLLLIAPAWAGAQTATAKPPAEAPATLTLTLHIELERQGPLVGGVERGRSRLRQHLDLSATLHASGAPMAYNPLDPEDAKRQWADAQRAQQRVQAAMATRPNATAPALDPAAMQARAQQLMARCGQDRACLMREASAMSASVVAAQAPAGQASTLQARLEAYGRAAAACEQEPAGPARQDCQDRARRAAGGGDDRADPTAQDDDLPEPYRLYVGLADCGLRLQAAVDERIEGDFDDVQGRVPFTQTLQGRHDAARDAVRCPLLQVVLDTRNGRRWTRVAEVMPELAAVRERRERGRQPQRQDGTHHLDWREADTALQQRLTRLDAAGEDHVRVPVAGGGEAMLRLRWRFAPG